MSAARHDITIHRGEDFDFTLRIIDLNEDPIPTSGGSFSVAAQIREGHRKPLAASFTLTILGDGEIKFRLTRTQTRSLDIARPYKWDFFYTDTAGTVKKLLYGDVTVVPNITHLTA